MLLGTGGRGGSFLSSPCCFSHWNGRFSQFSGWERLFPPFGLLLRVAAGFEGEIIALRGLGYQVIRYSASVVKSFPGIPWAHPKTEGSVLRSLRARRQPFRKTRRDGPVPCNRGVTALGILPRRGGRVSFALFCQITHLPWRARKVW